ncbi:MAG: spondin domain-containing protein, partial [Steroidobacteraceae bacterium]
MKRTSVFVAAIIAAFGASHSVFADDDRRPDRERVYEVTITNITPGETFTPILVATHSGRIALFSLGEPASNELAIL